MKLAQILSIAYSSIIALTSFVVVDGSDQLPSSSQTGRNLQRRQYDVYIRVSNLSNCAHNNAQGCYETCQPGQANAMDQPLLLPNQEELSCDTIDFQAIQSCCTPCTPILRDIVVDLLVASVERSKPDDSNNNSNNDSNNCPWSQGPTISEPLSWEERLRHRFDCYDDVHYFISDDDAPSTEELRGVLECLDSSTRAVVTDSRPTDVSERDENSSKTEPVLSFGAFVALLSVSFVLSLICLIAMVIRHTIGWDKLLNRKGDRDDEVEDSSVVGTVREGDDDMSVNSLGDEKDVVSAVVLVESGDANLADEKVTASRTPTI